MTSPRKRKAEIGRRMLVRDHEARELRLWDRMPPVGREFGSPDFERLMEEDHRNRVGVFDPALEGFGSGRLDKSSGSMQSHPHPSQTRDDRATRLHRPRALVRRRRCFVLAGRLAAK
jgi:hypothetical protein